MPKYTVTASIVGSWEIEADSYEIAYDHARYDEDLAKNIIENISDISVSYVDESQS